MIKKVIFSMAAIALLTFSCTRSEVENLNVSAPDAISLNPWTASTRAAIANLDSLKNDPLGFVVYADTAGATSWYISGASHIFNTTTGWGFSPLVLWPVIPTEYPVVFRAYYPDDASLTPGILTVGAAVPPATALDLTFVVPTVIEEQIDLLAAQDTAFSKPLNGLLNMNFKHILSKVNFTITNHDGTSQTSDADHKVYVLAVGFCNLYSTNTYDVVNEAWPALASGDPIADYNYYNSFVPLTGTDVYEELEFNDADKDLIIPSPPRRFENLMLLPQDDQDVWDISGIILDPTGTTDKYIKLLYRLQVSGNDDEVGYLDAINCPGYPGSVLPSGYRDPLYVLVGYAYAGTWEPGKGYSYDIPLPGVGGGIYLDDFYYDNQGNKTDLPISGAVIGGHVMSVDHIIINPAVALWDDTPGSSDVLE